MSALCLKLNHECRSTGCDDAGCELCRCNPNRVCVRHLRRRYRSGDSLLARCHASLQVQVWDAARQQPVTSDAQRPAGLIEVLLLNGDCLSNLQLEDAVISCEQLARCILPNQKDLLQRSAGGLHDRQSGSFTLKGRLLYELEASQADLSDLCVLASSELLLGSKDSTFCLLFCAVDEVGQRINGVQHHVSTPFMVYKAKQTTKSEAPLVTESISRLEHIGRATATKLEDLQSAGVDVPGGLRRIHSIGDFQGLMDECKGSLELTKQVMSVLRLSPTHWDELCAHAARAVDLDFRPRLWRPCRGSAAGLLFACGLGELQLGGAVAWVAAAGNARDALQDEVIFLEQLDGGRLAQVPALLKQACASWQSRGHPGWSIYWRDSDDKAMQAVRKVHDQAVERHAKRTGGGGSGMSGPLTPLKINTARRLQKKSSGRERALSPVAESGSPCKRTLPTERASSDEGRSLLLQAACVTSQDVSHTSSGLPASTMCHFPPFSPRRVLSRHPHSPQDVPSTPTLATGSPVHEAVHHSMQQYGSPTSSTTHRLSTCVPHAGHGLQHGGVSGHMPPQTPNSSEGASYLLPFLHASSSQQQKNHRQLSHQRQLSYSQPASPVSHKLYPCAPVNPDRPGINFSHFLRSHLLDAGTRHSGTNQQPWDVAAAAAVAVAGHSVAPATQGQLSACQAPQARLGDGRHITPALHTGKPVGCPSGADNMCTRGQDNAPFAAYQGGTHQSATSSPASQQLHTSEQQLLPHHNQGLQQRANVWPDAPPGAEMPPAHLCPSTPCGRSGSDPTPDHSACGPSGGVISPGSNASSCQSFDARRAWSEGGGVACLHAPQASCHMSRQVSPLQAAVAAALQASSASSSAGAAADPAALRLMAAMMQQYNAAALQYNALVRASRALDQPQAPPQPTWSPPRPDANRQSEQPCPQQSFPPQLWQQYQQQQQEHQQRQQQVFADTADVPQQAQRPSAHFYPEGQPPEPHGADGASFLKSFASQSSNRAAPSSAAVGLCSELWEQQRFRRGSCGGRGDMLFWPHEVSIRRADSDAAPTSRRPAVSPPGSPFPVDTPPAGEPFAWGHQSRGGVDTRAPETVRRQPPPPARAASTATAGTQMPCYPCSPAPAAPYARQCEAADAAASATASGAAEASIQGAPLQHVSCDGCGGDVPPATADRRGRRFSYSLSASCMPDAQMPWRLESPAAARDSPLLLPKGPADKAPQAQQLVGHSELAGQLQLAEQADRGTWPDAAQDAEPAVFGLWGGIGDIDDEDLRDLPEAGDVCGGPLDPDTLLQDVFADLLNDMDLQP